MEKCVSCYINIQNNSKCNRTRITPISVIKNESIFLDKNKNKTCTFTVTLGIIISYNLLHDDFICGSLSRKLMSFWHYN